MNQPRGRLINDANFEMTELVGQYLEQIVGYQCESSNETAADILGMLFSGANTWHRFFLDAGIGFWEELSKIDVFFDFEDCKRVDFTDRWQLRSLPNLESRCIGDFDSATPSTFEWKFSSGVLSFEYSKKTDNDSETIVIFKAENSSI